jgi:hypothetical protein
VSVRVKRHGDPDDPNLLLILGRGNRVRHDHVRWLVEQFPGYRVHAVEIPDNGTHFERDYLNPIESYAADLSGYKLLSHSTGGLVAAHMETDRPRVYFSPWWGLAERTAWLTERLAELPIARPVLPSGIGAEDIGPEVDPDTEERPVAPAFLGTVKRAQNRLPPFREDATVFCSLADSVVSTGAIGERAPAERVRLYDGGHEPFAAANREGILADARAALADPEWITGST